jgi:hypothetical protein
MGAVAAGHRTGAGNVNSTLNSGPTSIFSEYRGTKLP